MPVIHDLQVSLYLFDRVLLLLVFLIAMLFYSRLWMMAVLFPLGMKYYERMICQVEEKGKRHFERQFQDALQSLEAQLNVGYSMENA